MSLAAPQTCRFEPESCFRCWLRAWAPISEKSERHRPTPYSQEPLVFTSSLGWDSCSSKGQALAKVQKRDALVYLKKSKGVLRQVQLNESGYQVLRQCRLGSVSIS